MPEFIKQFTDIEEQELRQLLGYSRSTGFNALMGLTFKKLGEKILTTAGTSLTLNNLPPATEFIICVNITGASGVVQPSIRLNNDSGANYAGRTSTDGGASAGTSATNQIIMISASSASDFFGIFTLSNRQTSQKLGVGQGYITGGGTTSGTQYEISGHWNNIVDFINRIDIISNTANNFGVGSRLTIYGKQ